MLLDNAGVAAMILHLFPRSLVVTPNIPEAIRLTGDLINSVDKMKTAATRIAEMGAPNVIIKGGHLEGDLVVDILRLTDGTIIEIQRPKILTDCTHGTGCAFSAALAALLAQGESLKHAFAEAGNFMEYALSTSYRVGKGGGPPNHRCG
jgi:hydroxymethylpyrimidine/phosphomethylpyrimidine kinase